MKSLVTGAAGFVGSHLCERLIEAGHAVWGVDCFTDYYERARKEENLATARRSSAFELVEADLATCHVPSLLAGVDAVFHLAAQPGVRGSWGERFDVYVRNNVTATQRLLEALKERPVPCVFASSSSVYGAVERLPAHEDDQPRPISPYGVTKLAGEHLAALYHRAHGTPVVTVRYFTVFGPRQRPDMAFSRFIEAALAARPVQVLGTGEQTRDFTYADDAVEATILALGAPAGQVYNVGGGNLASVREALAVIERLVGRPLVIEHLPSAPGDPPHTAADTTRAREDLGWEPKISLEDGLAAQVDWARARLGA